MDNKVTVNTTGAIGADAVGGESHGIGSVTNNVVEIIKGMVGRDVYGGRCNNNARTASGNLAKVVNGTIVGDVFGCHSTNVLLDSNTVESSNGNIAGNVNGGFSNNSKVVNNTVEIFNGNISSGVYGGFSGLDVTGNEVELHGGPLQTIFMADVLLTVRHLIMWLKSMMVLLIRMFMKVGLIIMVL
ncbi:MAG: hypothetical protein LBG23_02135 [Endomicrobium sp.]|nr:hypothetical protein [Endomicrobium sp.]